MFTYTLILLQEKKGGTNPFAASPEPAASDSNTPNILDLFGVPEGGAAGASASAGASGASAPETSDKASADLLQLAGNPFASVLNASSNNTSVAQSTAGPAASEAASTVPPQSFSSSPFTSAVSNANGIIAK